MKRIRLGSIGIAALMAAAVGCARGNGQEDSAQSPQEAAPVNENARNAAASINRFGFRMLAQLATQGGKNVFISPLSISSALAMTWNGTAGETAAEMAKVLELGGIDQESANRGFQALMEGLKQKDPKAQVDIANALWLDRQPNPKFLQTVQSFFAAEASHVNFANAQEAAGRINSWVKEKTREKIDRILSAQDLGANTDIVLTNAIYFKGEWTTRFDPDRTAEGEFVLADGSRKKMQMMSGEKIPLKSLSEKAFQAVSLPYGDGRYRMYLFVPSRETGLKDFLASLTAAKWQEWMGKFRDDRKTIVMPRFKVETEQSLVEPLNALGMKLAFGGGDFGPMGFPGSFISEVKHKALMEVNEEGTVAAAATAVVVTRSIEIPFMVDRPFFAAIRDERSGALLFIGAIHDPAPLS
jgi:serpin B